MIWKAKRTLRTAISILTTKKLANLYRRSFDVYLMASSRRRASFCGLFELVVNDFNAVRHSMMENQKPTEYTLPRKRYYVELNNSG